MDTDILFELATPYLDKNDFGVAHTKRVFSIAEQNFSVKPELRDLTYASIILHDIGGSTIKDQYGKGPPIAMLLLQKLGCPDDFIRQVCEIISTHHDHPDTPSDPFKVLYDSDKLAMFSKEEYPHYDLSKNFDWSKIVTQIYSKKAKKLAQEMLIKRRREEENI